MNTATLMWPRYPGSTTDMWLIKRCSLRSQINFGSIWQGQGSLVTQECFVHQALLPLDVSVALIPLGSWQYAHSYRGTMHLTDMFRALLRPTGAIKHSTEKLHLLLKAKNTFHLDVEGTIKQRMYGKKKNNHLQIITHSDL